MPGVGRALRPLTKEPVIKDFLTYDMEWYPGTQKLRVICVYDGNRARHYFTAKAFVDNEFVPANAGKRFYAHAGGMFDVAYLLQHLVLETGHPITAAFSASSAVVVSVKVGGHKFMLCDSFFLLRSKLSDIAKWIGERKGTDLEGDKDPEQTALEKFHAPIEELIEYCKSDCIILWKALRATQIGLFELGCEMKVTAASTAMGFFRSRFLGEVIPTSDAVNRVARPAYKASRVEIVMPVAKKHWCYDFNSSFPFSMTFPQPGRLIKTQWRHLPKPGVIYLAEVKVKVPVTHLPAVPYSKEGRVYFPTGTWGPDWMCSVDIELLQESGGEVLEVGRVLIFESQSWLSDYVHLLYDMRKNETDPFRRELLKILLNSCYGKFAENEEKTQLLIHPQKTTCPHKPPCERLNHDTGEYDGDACMEMLFPGAFLMTKRKPVHHVWVPISMHITALSRQLLWDGMQSCHEAGYEVSYCDTDSIFTNAPPKDCDNPGGVPTGTELGELKLDPPHRYERLDFIAPKVYVGTLEPTGDPKKDKRKIRAKGFPGLDDEMFDLLQSGYDVGFRSSKKVKGLFRSGNLTPRDDVTYKGLAGTVRPKRCPMPGNQTRPWDVSELEEDE